ncbi:MAG: ArsI/CadI family heavy metal resistance metalloenzyme [bacterium]
MSVLPAAPSPIPIGPAPPRSRVQLALNVADLEASVAFYSAMLGVTPHKRRPGYANFVVDDPALKLVLIEGPDADRGSGTRSALNHLGIEVFSTEDVTDAAQRFRAAGLSTFSEAETSCCFAVQDKVWVHDPDGAPWEVYVVTDDDPTGLLAASLDSEAPDSCCRTEGS